MKSLSRIVWVGEALPGLAGLAAELATSPLAAGQALARPADLLLVHGGSPWARAIVGAIPVDVRPPVLVVGGAPDPELADEWLAQPGWGEELATRARLARARCRFRRRHARRGLTDLLTGLPNRRAVIRRLVRERSLCRREGRPLSLVLLDLDDFKAVNERQGHAAGDRLLRDVGAAIRGAIRGDELLGRIGGDEFALVLRGDAAAARAAAARVEEALATRGVRATTAAAALETGERLQDLYRRTDVLLRAGKRSRGRPVEREPVAPAPSAERRVPQRRPPLPADEPPRVRVEELPPRLGEELPPRLGEELPPRLGEELPPRLGEELPPRLGEELPPRLGEELPPRLGEELPAAIVAPARRRPRELPRENARAGTLHALLAAAAVGAFFLGALLAGRDDGEVAEVGGRVIAPGALGHVPFPAVVSLHAGDEVVAQARTGADGSFLLHAAPGTYLLRATAGDDELAAEPVVVEPGSWSHVLEIVAPPGGRPPQA